jgi:hypothetical protein
MSTVKVNYRAKSERSSTIKLDAPVVSMDIHQMVVWILLNQDAAKALLPHCQSLRTKPLLAAKEEGEIRAAVTADQGKEFA